MTPTTSKIIAEFEEKMTPLEDDIWDNVMEELAKSSSSLIQY